MVERWPKTSALAVYAVLGLLLFGLPVLDDPGGEVIAAEEIEPSAYQWFLAWWPDAIGDWRNPFVTDLIFPPDGRNLTWVTSVAGPSLVLAPVTLAFGPVVSFNVFSLAAPILAAWTGFLLCRHLTGAFWPSLAGGYLFGFSAYLISNMQGVPNLTTVALLPMFLYLVVRRVEGSMSTRRFVLFGAPAVAFQFLTSNELLAMAVVFGTAAWLLALWLLPERRDGLRETAVAVLLTGLASAVLLSPYLYYMFFEPALRPTHAIPENYSADLLSFVFPSGVNEIGDRAFRNLAATFGGEGGPFGGGGRAYLGVPLLVIVGWFAVERWRTRGARLLVLMVAVTAVASLGPKLHVAGIRTVSLPWRPFTELPLLEYAVPVTFSVFTTMGVAVVVALWLARRQTLLRWAVVALAAALLFPNLGSGRWQAEAPTPAFFEDERYERELSQHDRVFIVPFFGAGPRWHAQSGMAFELAGGYVGQVPRDYDRFYYSITPDDPHASAAPLRAFMRRKRVSVILVDERVAPRWGELLGTLGVRPVRMGGVLMYRLRPVPSS